MEASRSISGVSGAVTALVRSLREKKGIEEFILVGQRFSMPRPVCTMPIAALEEEEGVRVVLIAPEIPKNESDLAKWPVKTQSTFIGNVPPADWFLENPKGLEWVKDNTPVFDDKLAPGEPVVWLGSDLPHTKFANWLLEQFSK